MKKIGLIILLTTCTLFAFAGPVQELMELAESAFAKGNFVKAKNYYTDIISLESATESQVKDARYNIAVCQEHINEQTYQNGYGKALSLFQSKNFSQSRHICFGLLKYGRYKLQTNRLIQQCNDSITARYIAQQRADSINSINALLAEYNAIIEDAKAYYDNKQYSDAINICKKSFDAKFVTLNKPIPFWYGRSIQIYDAQKKGMAITPQFAARLRNAYYVEDVSEGIARMKFTNNKVDSTMYVSTLGDIIIAEKGYKNSDYCSGFVCVKYSDGDARFYDRLGKSISLHEISVSHFYELGENIITNVYDFSDDMAPFCIKDTKWGYLDKNFNVAIKPQYDCVSAFHEGRAFVRKKGKWQIIDKAGNVILSKLYPAFHCSAFDGKTGYWSEVDHSYYSNGKIWVSSDKGKLKLVDKNGNLIGNFDKILPNILIHKNVFFDGLAIFDTLLDKYGYIDEYSKIKIQPIYDKAYGFHEGVATVKRGNKWLVIDIQGNELTKPLFDDVSCNGFSEGLCAAKLNGKWGFIDKSGNWIIPPIYDCPFLIKNGAVGDFHSGFAVVAFDGRLGYVDKFGNSTFDFQ